MRKAWFIIIALVFISAISYSEQIIDGNIYYDKFSLVLNGDGIVFSEQGKKYPFPSKNDEYLGIRKMVQADLKGDGKKEYILAVQLQGEKTVYPNGQFDVNPLFPHAVVLICEPIGKHLRIMKSILVGGTQPDFDLVDVTQSGRKDVVAKGWDLPKWSFLKIVGWHDGRFKYLWNDEGDGIVEHILKIKDNGAAQIEVGVSNPNDSRTPVGPDHWKIWDWNGKKFVHTKDVPLTKEEKE